MPNREHMLGYINANYFEALYGAPARPAPMASPRAPAPFDHTQRNRNLDAVETAKLKVPTLLPHQIAAIDLLRARAERPGHAFFEPKKEEYALKTLKLGGVTYTEIKPDPDPDGRSLTFDESTPLKKPKPKAATAKAGTKGFFAHAAETPMQS